MEEVTERVISARNLANVSDLETIFVIVIYECGMLCSVHLTTK